MVVEKMRRLLRTNEDIDYDDDDDCGCVGLVRKVLVTNRQRSGASSHVHARQQLAKI